VTNLPPNFISSASLAQWAKELERKIELSRLDRFYLHGIRHSLKQKINLTHAQLETIAELSRRYG
jgi:hypothetical protein